jgi:iron-sulfur cluster assembly protein
MADPAAPERPLTLEEKKAAARERAKAAREAQQQGAGAGLEVTQAAADYIAQCADREGMAHAVRLRIHAGGCSGLEYSIDLVEQDAAPDPSERVIESNGVSVFLDLKSAIYVSGSVIDYTTSLMRRGFVIKNPNATSTCSCGDSFGV